MTRRPHTALIRPLVIGLTLISFTASALAVTSSKATKTKASRLHSRKLSSSTNGPQFEIKSVYGEKIVTFSLAKTTAGADLSLVTNDGTVKKQTISAKDFGFLKKKISQLPTANNQISFCPRSYISITTESRESIACIGSPTPIAKRPTELVNLLSLQF